MKKLKWLAAFLIVATLFGGILGCKQEVEIPSDKTAPADVTELTVTNKDASVLLTWTDATDKDIYGYEVTWNNNAPINRSAAMEANSMMVAPGAKGCYISNLTNGTEYAFTVKSVDTSGNKSAGVTKTITKTNTPTIIVDAKKDIFLVPSTTEKTNQDVTVKVEINSEIAESVEKILLKTGINIALSGDDITESKEFVATKNNTYTVVIKYTDGTFEFFFIDINNIDKTAPNQVSDVNIAYSKETGKITLSWTNPTDEDFVGTKIVYELEGSEETTTLTFDKDTTETVLENVEGTYNVKIYAMDDAENFSVYTFSFSIGIPKITSVSIPVAGTDYAGNVLPVRINGINFKALDTGGATASGFTSTGVTLNNVRIVSETLATAEITCPSVIGTTDVTVSYGESSATTTLQVIESVASSYAVGDIILTNGTKVSVANVITYTIDENNKPIGVVAMISDIYGVPTPKVIGLQQSASTLKWALSGTTGYITKFTNIVCTPSQTYEGAALTATFTGDTEGSDNWAEICAVDPIGTQDLATDYPIFNFANTYGTTAGLIGTDYENGWYVPSVAELCEVYKNKEVIQTSLTKASGFNFYTSGYYYWSSSQYASNDNRTYVVGFANGYVGNLNKDLSSTYSDLNFVVFVLQALTAK